MTLEQLVARETDGNLMDIYDELSSAIVPSTSYTRNYIRKVNRMIDAGKLCINPTTYRKVYLPTFAKVVKDELARRYIDHLQHTK